MSTFKSLYAYYKRGYLTLDEYMRLYRRDYALMILEVGRVQLLIPSFWSWDGSMDDRLNYYGSGGA